ncbi:MAG TPA: signal peptidase II, partial [Ilumatobacteraceae bacterium]|nr:signal peptidase II [Ilumatobacteraceae bacterium]
MDALRRLRGALLIAAVVVLVDQLTKHWAVNNLQDRNIDVIGSLRFNLAYNTGMAFSKGTGIGPVIGIVALLVVVGLLISIGRSSSPLYTPAVGLIIGGAVGNIVDRLFRSPGWFRGGVVDFIDVQWWPIFNVADIAVTVGGILLLLTTLRGERSPAPAGDVPGRVTPEPDATASTDDDPVAGPADATGDAVAPTSTARVADRADRRD